MESRLSAVPQRPPPSPLASHTLKRKREMVKVVEKADIRGGSRSRKRLRILPPDKPSSSDFKDEHAVLQVQVTSYSESDGKFPAFTDYDWEHLSSENDEYAEATLQWQQERDEQLARGFKKPRRNLHRDENPPQYWLQLYGRCREGYSVCLHVSYWPVVIVQLPNSLKTAEQIAQA